MSVSDALYHDPRLVGLYDLFNSDRADFDFYLSRLPDRQCDVLDLGCGTGSFAIDLAARGHRMVAADPSAQMISLARSKPGAAGVEWRILAAGFPPGESRFDIVLMTGHAFQCLLTDTAISAVFRSVARLLRPDGSFLFETRDPRARAWEKWRPEFASAPVSTGGEGQARVVHDIVSVETISSRSRKPTVSSRAARKSLRPADCVLPQQKRSWHWQAQLGYGRDRSRAISAARRQVRN